MVRALCLVKLRSYKAFHGGGVTLLVKRYRQPLKAGKGQKKNSLLELLEGMQFCQYLAFKAARPTSDF